ncbi:DUF3822 family protein [Lewinella sp. W8]|uniref:DUF3822 family protein n=1 Tax=Lewinella sp. W8 TaxID=2528208 RepID=UPI0010679626|nr:DUF3822 family protein [Lewinella sp. W8]MTB49656.1 DUF3822 family protein [Lewinella sp. W8]
MAISSYDITAAAFQPGKAHNYELSILTGMDSFAYIIRDRIKNQLLAYRSLSLTPEEQKSWGESIYRLIKADDKLRSLRYGSSVLGWESPRMTLVPDALYQEHQNRQYLEQLTLIGLEDLVRSERINDLEAQLIFGASKNRLDAVERRLSPLRTTHMAGGLLTAWGNRSRRLRHQAVSASVRGGRLFLAAHQNGNLLYFNTFTFRKAPDAVYYLLLAYQQCGWTPKRVPLYLSGEITDQSELFRQFYRYVEDIRFSAYGAPPANPPEMTSLPGHVFFELLCLG